MEHADDFRAFQSIWGKVTSGDFSNLMLRGQEATYTVSEGSNKVPVYHGALYYYFHMPFAALTGFDPVKLLYFRVLLDLVSVVGLFQIVTKLFNSKATGLFASLFYVSLFWTNVYARYIWTPSMMPVFTIMSIYGYVFRQKGLAYWFVIGLGAGAASQVQVSGYWVVIYMITLLMIEKAIIGKKNLLAISLGFLMTMWPSILYELSTNFEMIRHIFSAITNPGGFVPAQFSVDFFKIYFHMMEGLIFGNVYTEDLILTKLLRVGSTLIFSVVGLASYIAYKHKSTMIPLSIIMIMPIPWIMSSYYLYSQPDSFERIIFVTTPFINNINYFLPFLAILIGLLANYIRDSKMLVNIFIVSILSWILFVNIASTTTNFYSAKSMDYNAGSKIESVKLIANDVGDDRYDLIVNPVVGRNDEWEYLSGVYTGRHPEHFNHESVIGHQLFPVYLEGREAEVLYEVVDRRYDYGKVESEWTKLGESGIYEIWKKYYAQE